MGTFTDTTQDIIRRVFVMKGWKITEFVVDTRLGAVRVDIEW